MSAWQTSSKSREVSLFPAPASRAEHISTSDVHADHSPTRLAIAIAQCPPSPTLTVKVGRTDSSTANPTAIPGPNSNATTLIAAFAEKGFTTGDLVALVGAHSAGKNLSDVAFDTTVDELDSPGFYGEVLNDTAPAVLASDLSLATDDASKSEWIEYRDSQSKWNTDFASA